MRDRSEVEKERKIKIVRKKRGARQKKKSKNKLTSNARWLPKLNDHQVKQNLKAPTTPKKGGCKRRVERREKGRRR